MKIGIYGGSFNPPHRMHKAIVDGILKKGYVDKVIVVPTADNYKKPNLIPGSFRVKMCEGIFKNSKRVEVSSFEVDGSLYTLNTLNHFKEKYPKADLYFILRNWPFCYTRILVQIWANLTQLQTTSNY